MDEATIRLLLGYTVKCLLDEHSKDKHIHDSDLLAKKVANACFDGLAVALRECFARNQKFCLGEVGVFHPGNEWTFVPAASLIEAEALNLPVEEGRLRLAREALFYLTQGIELLNDCETDVAIARTESEALAPEERLLRAMFGETVMSQNLSDRVHSLLLKIGRIHQRLTQPLESQLAGHEESVEDLIRAVKEPYVPKTPG